MPSNGTVEVTSRDLLTLEDIEFLNDSVIEFFIKKLQHNMTPDVAKRCHIFNSFFFEKLTNDREERSEPADVKQKKAHERVAKWTKGVYHPGRVQQTEAIDVDDVNLGERPEAPQAPHPFLLHLDSMSGRHNTRRRFRRHTAPAFLRI